MPICIECGFKLNNLYTTYSKADDRTLGKGVRLTQCPRCKRFADKYVEHDFVVIFIDLILIKPQVSLALDTQFIRFFCILEEQMLVEDRKAQCAQAFPPSSLTMHLLSSIIKT